MEETRDKEMRYLKYIVIDNDEHVSGYLKYGYIFTKDGKSSIYWGDVNYYLDKKMEFSIEDDGSIGTLDWARKLSKVELVGRGFDKRFWNL